MFAFTAGIGAFLWMGRQRTKLQLSRFLVTRGLWLIVLELTVLRWILFLQFGWTGQLVILSVIWMLGLCMIVLAALIHLPTRWLATLAVAMIAVHNLFDSVEPSRFGRVAWLWDILHVQSIFPFSYRRTRPARARFWYPPRRLFSPCSRPPGRPLCRAPRR